MDDNGENQPPIRSSAPTGMLVPKSVPSAVKKLILELGLRYRPASADQLDGHQAKLVALMIDLRDIPPESLERSIRHWVLQSPYLPKASDLADLAKGFVAQSEGRTGERLDQASRANARLDSESPGFPARWIYDQGGALQLVPIAEYRSHMASKSPQAEAAE